MKKIKRILKWTGIILLFLIVGITITTATRQNLKYDAPYPAIKASTDSAIIAKGKHLALSVAHCTHCHSNANSDSLLKSGSDVSLDGGFAFKIPIGTIYSANITSDPVWGIGKYTDAEIARSLRYGVHPDGTAVYDFMPFHNLSDEDLTAILSYIRTQKPVARKIPAHNLNIIGNIVKAFLVKPVGPTEKIETAVKLDTTAAYGRYLTLNAANCSGCHTERGLSGEFTGALLAGGKPMESGNVPPNLTPDSTGRLFGWNQQAFIQRFRTGKIKPNSEMPWNMYQQMTDVELKAIYNYLQTVKPVKTKPVL
jgi:mono/diheme cytochrome c family protein